MKSPSAVSTLKIAPAIPLPVFASPLKMTRLGSVSAPDGYIISEICTKTVTVKVGVVNRVEFMDAEKGSLVVRLEDQKDGHNLDDQPSSAILKDHNLGVARNYGCPNLYVYHGVAIRRIGLFDDIVASLSWSMLRLANRPT